MYIFTVNVIQQSYSKYLSMSLMSCGPIANHNPKQKSDELIQINWNTCSANSREIKTRIGFEINVGQKINFLKEYQF